MNAILNILQKFFFFEQEPQKIGLTGFKTPVETKKQEKPSLRNKDVKLSDLMRRS